MIFISIGDWVLARSEGFRVLITKFRDHKIQTKNSFSKIKSVHKKVDTVLEEYGERIFELERVLKELHKVPIIKVKKKR